MTPMMSELEAALAISADDSAYAHIPGRRRFGWYKSGAHAVLDLQIVAKPLDVENWDEFRKFTRVVELLRAYTIDFRALSNDHAALLRAEIEIGDELSAHFSRSMISINQGVEANARAQQLATNFLGAASAFRDRCMSRLSRHFGSDSETARKFKEVTSTIHDASFAYRISYHLRNFAQHNELPISLVPINASRMDDGTMAASVAFHLDPPLLLERGKFKSSVAAELAAFGTRKVSLNRILEEYMVAHRHLMLTIIGFFAPALVEMVYYAREVERVLEIPSGCTPVIWEGDDPAAGPQTQERCIMFGFDEMQNALELFSQLDAADFSSAYSNQIEKSLVEGARD